MAKPDRSEVIITFNDGEVKTYIISASPSVASYLASNAGHTGILTLWNGTQSWGIPVASIRDWCITPLPSEVTEQCEVTEPSPAATLTEQAFSSIKANCAARRKRKKKSIWDGA